MSYNIEQGSAEWYEWRACVYLLLARLYRQVPDREVLQAIVNEGLLHDLFDEVDCPAIRQMATALEESVAANLADLDSFRGELEADFNRLFIGPGPLLAPPWESVYLSKERLIFGEQTLEVREFYQSFGLASKTKDREPDDHVALELEFMSWLCQQAAIADHEGALKLAAGQKTFLDSHLAKWISKFCADVTSGSATAFYQAVGRLTAAWVEIDNN